MRVNIEKTGYTMHVSLCYATYCANTAIHVRTHSKSMMMGEHEQTIPRNRFHPYPYRSEKHIIVEIIASMFIQTP